MNVAILGLGVVGKGIYDIIESSNKGINVLYVLELDSNKTKNISATVASDLEIIINDDQVDVVIELIGGTDFAYTAIKMSLEAKKHVVTANKAVLSLHLEELTKLAITHNVTLRYEASVAGGTIVLDPLYNLSNNNNIYSIKGIINGSTNFILSKFFIENTSFESSLKQAYEQGYLETGNNDDMEGLDLLRKINILSSISYHHFFDEKECHVNPLSSITSEFLNYIKSKNLIVKYIGESFLEDGKVSIRVEPVILNNNDFYSNINYEQNIVEFKGDNFDHLAFVGIGAGRYPTASVVYNDLIQIKNDNTSRFSFTNKSLIVDNNIRKYKYLVLSNGDFVVTDEITIYELKTTYKNVVCYARIEGDLNV